MRAATTHPERDDRETPAAPPAPDPLLERGAELAAVDALVARIAAGKGGVLALEGPAGIGKSALAAAARTRAQRAGVAVAAAGGSELESGFGFAVARQLLGMGDAPGGEDPEATIHALFWQAADRAAQRPLLVVADDLQWIDEPSRRLLAYLARRVTGLPLGLLVCRRPPLPGEERRVADAIVDAPGAIVLRPAPLTEPAVGALAARRLGAEPEPGFARACHRATGGNALLVEELLTELRGRPLPAGAPPEEVAATVPERVARGVLRRVAALPAASGRLARAVAVLGDAAPLDVAAGLAGLDAGDAVAAASALTAADVLADGIPLGFRHPLVRAAVRGNLTAVEAADLHGRAARLLAARGAPVAAVAGHLLAGAPGGDPWAVAQLVAAAEESRAHGAPATAADQLARALAEPPPAARRGPVLRALGAAELAAGRPAGAARLREAIAATEDPRERARIGLELASALHDHMRGAEGVAVARAALAGLGDADRELRLLLEAAAAECVRMDPGVAGDEPARLRKLAEGLTGATPGERLVLASVAMTADGGTAAGHVRAAEQVERVTASGPLPWGSPETGIASSFIRAGRLDEAAVRIERGLAAAARDGAVLKHLRMVQMRGWLAAERGMLGDAEADLGDALALAQELGAPTGFAAAGLAGVRAEQGAHAEAARLLAAHGMDGPLPDHQTMHPALFARARVRLAARRPDDAVADALELGRRYARLGIHRAVPAWRGLAAVVLAARGERAEALRLAQEELALAERWNTPAAIGVALRSLGLVTGDAARLEAAVAMLARSGARLELAHAQVELGAALRRAGRRVDARPALGAGMDAAHALGAAALAERARTELRATGARPRRLVLSGPDALTVSERRVAGLAAEGMTNRAIAQALFVTTATVETHLRHVFQKLDLGGRGELAAALAHAERP